ncbi:MAG: alpha/beta fold hydrolase [Acidobacteria bacterium]|nr:alpha/beta fold hydrolase [Acidobacteriota bacterium]
MNRGRLSLLFGLLLAASILTPQSGAQDAIFYPPSERAPKKKGAKPVPPNPAKVEVLNRQSAKIETLADGETVKLKVTLNKPSELAYVASFRFADDERQIEKCIIALGAQSCETPLAPSLGWYWGKDGKGQAEREMLCESRDPGLLDTMKFSGAAKLRISPRPVVLVHGLASNATTWTEYIKPDGYLATKGLRGFAIGDGQAEGQMFTGDPSEPLKHTSTIAENADGLAQYIAGVKQVTGAQMVDLVAHSMGGLISRYYIDRLMKDRDVAQLIMLGSPHGGTRCASLPASLGFYLPATLELRPAYLSEVFNRQIKRRQGVPFYLLAGNPIIESFKAPCTATPSDLVVDRPSVATVTAPITEAPLLHTDMTGAERVFKDFVAPHLLRRAGEFPADRDPPLPSTTAAPEQFTKVFTGHVDAGGSREIVINLDKLSVASFALYDTTRSLSVTVRGASGNVINLAPGANGLVEVKDPAALFTLGYGFNKPAPGAWKITLQATERTPGKGADYALAAKVVGGAVLRTRADQMVVKPDQPITISSSLELAGRPMTGVTMQALIRRFDSGTEEINFTDSGDEKRAVWIPKESGIYAVDVVARGSTPDGLQVERADFLTFEVQPDPTRGQLSLALMVIAGITLVTALIFWLMNRRVSKPR